MVRRSSLRRFWKEQRGISLTEGLLVLPVMMLITGILVEYSAALMQWNKLVKAVQVAGRFAAVSDPLTDISILELHPADRGQGDAMPATAVSVSCGSGTGTACNAAALNRLYTGGDGVCGSVTNSIRGVCDIAPFVPAENIRVTYSNGGLGYVGRPNGAVAIVTVEIPDVQFEFLFLEALFDIYGGTGADWTYPAFPVTFIGEDLASCEDC